MTDQEIATAAAALAQAHRNATWIEALPMPPASAAEAHAIQDRVASLLGETVGGFKISAPADRAPTRGVIYARTIRTSPAHVAPQDAPHFGVEGEIAFRFTRDLPPRRAAYARAEVADAAVALPAIEVVSGRFRDPRARPALEQLADGMTNAGLVLGTAFPGWRTLDLPRLQVALLVNGAPVLERQGGHPTDDPLGSAVALVNEMRDAGGVRAGQVVTTGSWTGLRFYGPGDRCTVRFEHLGEAELTFGG